MFVNTFMLLGLAAVAVPVLIHLLHKQRTQRVQWGAMQFLLESSLQERRRQKVEHWLLLLVRMGVLALLALALSRPILLGKSNPIASDLPTDVAVVLDHSLSTGRTAGGPGGSGAISQKTLFDQGADTVDELAKLLKPGDSLSVVLAEHTPRVVTPLPVSSGEAPAVAAKLHQLPQGTTDCSIPECIETAREVANRGRNLRKLIFVISDEQRPNWHIDDDAAWRLPAWAREDSVRKNIAVHALALKGDPDASDIAVGNLTIEPHVLGIERPAEISATFTNVGAHDVANITARFLVDGKQIESRPIGTIPGNSFQTIRFDHTFSSAGSHWVSVQTDVIDALAADNTAVAAVHVWQKLPLLIVDGQLTDTGTFPSSGFLAAAMQPVEPGTEKDAFVQPKIVSVSDTTSVNLEDYDMVVLNDCAQLPSDLQLKLSDYVRSGHGLWIILGPRTQPEYITKDLADAGLLNAAVTRPPNALPASSSASASNTPAAPASTGATLEIKDPTSPMISLLATAENNALSGMVTNQWWALSPKDSNTHVVLAANGNDPLIFERAVGRNGGRIAVWTTGVDGLWNNWPMMPNFVPLVELTVYHLCSGQTPSSETGSLDAGLPIVWNAKADSPIDSVEVSLPDHTTVPGSKPTLASGRYEFRYNNAFEPGLYSLHFLPAGQQPTVYFGVGIDPHELDPANLSNTDIDWLSTNGYLDQARPEITAADMDATLRQSNPGTELWKWLAFFVLGSLLFETWLTYRAIGRQQNIEVATAGLAKKTALAE
jgi:hypothetical protein